MSPRLYTSLLLFISGMGGLLYGYDIGIIGAALLYLGKTIYLSLAQESLIVAAVLGGGTISSLVAGALADVIGRKKLMIAAALLFIASVVLIVTARGFGPLFAGRTLQGLSAGMIAVVIPLYLAECLPAPIRGRGTAVFQLMLTTGILVSLAVGAHFARGVDALAASTSLTPAALIAAQDSAWRAMFLSAIYPGLVFLAGSLLVTESPRWLLGRGRTDDSRRALARSRAPAELEAEFARMTASTPPSATPGARGSLWQRRYIVPFLLTCTILGLTQATGINSILQFIVIILQQAGLDASTSAEKATLVTAVNVAFTIVGLLLVDKLGRKALLMIGTGGITLSLIASAAIFYGFESERVDVTESVRARVSGNALTMLVEEPVRGSSHLKVPMQLTLLYAQGGEERLVTGFSRAADPVLTIPADKNGRALDIKRAKFGPVPAGRTGTLVMLCLMLFIASFAIGPGVCVWLALTELMPTRIRSLGMGLGLLINQGISTLIAAAFLPVVGNFGYTSIFIFWAVCTAAFFSVAAFWLPETKGRTLEEIEAHFAR